MRTPVLHINNENLEYYSFLRVNEGGSTNRAELEHKKEFLVKAMEAELTDLQRYCLTQYFLEGRLQKEIAAQLGLHCSTVSRHISAGLKKLKGVSRYYVKLPA